MGQQPSKRAGSPSNSDAVQTGRVSTDGLESYPSFSKADTKESTRSIRGSIRSKIPGTTKTESPKASQVAVAGVESGSGGAGEKSESASIGSVVGSHHTGHHSGHHTGFRHSRKNSRNTTHSPPPELSASRIAESDSPIPRSPIQSSSGGHHGPFGKSHHHGEIGNVSDGPPTGTRHQSHMSKPKESILVKKDNTVNHRVSEILASPVHNDASASNSPTMGIGALRSIDLDEMITRLLDAGYAGKVTKAVCLKNAEITAICTAAREVLLSQPALVELAPPVKIVGDVHGQYTDLLRMFEMCGFPPSANYLFLGDYVDRGKQSLETILLLLCYKLKFPENFFLLRGNHECANVTRVYGFYDECKRRCTIKVWKTFVDTFNCLPIASIVAGKIFCVHGGLSPSLTDMDDIRNIARPTDVPDYGLLNDLLWSDPAEMDSNWEANERGVSYVFGKAVIMDFLQRHDFDLVCRAHMVVEDGYEFFSDRILVTVFSAPNVSRLLYSFISSEQAS